MHIRRLDFMARPNRYSSFGLVLLVAGSLLSAAAVFDDSTRSDELAALQMRLQRVKSAYHRSELAHGGTHGPALGDFKQVANVEQRLSAPWGNLLDTLEHAQNDSIALLGIEPDGGNGRLRLGGEAKDLPALVAYMQTLEGKGGISHLRLITQQVKQDDAQHPVIFMLEAQWTVMQAPAGESRASS